MITNVSFAFESLDTCLECTLDKFIIILYGIHSKLHFNSSWTCYPRNIHNKIVSIFFFLPDICFSELGLVARVYFKPEMRLISEKWSQNLLLNV